MTGMGLQWDTCMVCSERHALQRSGAMSIHTNEFGKRCAGSGNVPIYEQRRDPKAKRTEAAKRDAAKSQRDAEREAAFAAVKRNRKYGLDKKPADKLDRRIYATKGVHTVSGGLPGTRRGH